jgi:suppressor of fused
MSYGPGWSAIDAEWSRLYTAREPIVFRGPEDPRVSTDPCKQVVGWDAETYWHLVGYGLTELFEKVSPLPAKDGWGYEITLRIPRAGDDTGPPIWAVQLVESLTRYVETTERSLEEGDWLQFEEGFVPETNLVAAVFARDPAFPEPIEGPFGRFFFRQAIGMNAAEVRVRQEIGTKAFLDVLARRDPLLCTRPGRV